jgi:hypothetical protein
MDPITRRIHGEFALGAGVVESHHRLILIGLFIVRKTITKKKGLKGGYYQFNPGLIVCRRDPAITQLQLPRARCLVVRPGPACGARLAVLCSEADVKGAEHGDVDGEAGQHELDGAEHEGGERGAGQVADEVDFVDYDCCCCVSESVFGGWLGMTY